MEPLDFNPPFQVDDWGPGAGGYTVWVSIHITGGLPPFTVYHDGQVQHTWERVVSFSYVEARCTLVHGITVESADGQKVTHDYWIRAPWCEE